MKKILSLIIICVALAASASAQSVTVDANIDSLQILIGEQAHIKLQVSLDADKRAIFPIFKDTIVRGVEVVETLKPDTQLLNGGKRTLITQEYTVTSFDSALYYIPPMQVLVDNKPYLSEALALKVYSIDVDTLHPDQFFGPKDVMGLSFMWSDWYMTIACVLLWVPLVLLLAFLVKCFYNNKPIIRRVKVAPKQSPYKVATEGIERIRAEKSWQKESPKAYYTDLTDVVRTYIKNRFGFDALEMTSAQIIEALQQTHDRDALRDLTDLFLTADLVKFAKHTPLMNENDANLLVALNFINDTKEVEAVDAKPEPTEITVVEKRPLRTKLLLGGAILLLVAALIVLSMCAATEIYGYFF